MGPGRFPRRADYLRVSRELKDAHALFTDNGWLANPLAYHRAPPPLERPVTLPAWTLTSGRSPVVRFEKILFPSEFEPRPGEIGRDRWMAYGPNHTASAWVLRHKGGPRPWLVCIHGFGMGYPIADFGAFDARRVHEELGFNVALPVLPLHGERKVSRWSGEAFLSYDLMNTVHGLTQAIWDIRRLLSFVRQEGATSIGVYGVSLGAYVTALLAAVHGDFDYALAGIPVSDYVALFRSHSPGHVRLRADEHDPIGPIAEGVQRVVSPLAMPAKLPKERLFLYAGLGDRVVRPSQAYALWQHWGKPEILWYHGNHVGFLLSREVRAFVSRVLGGFAPKGASAA